MEVEERFKLAKRISDLRSMPRRNLEEKEELDVLVEKYESNMQQMGRKAK